MDVVVADIPPRFAMLLSQSQRNKLGCTIHLYISSDYILVFCGEYRILYREVQLYFTISDPKNPSNHQIYIIHEDIGTFMFQRQYFDDGNWLLRISIWENEAGKWHGIALRHNVGVTFIIQHQFHSSWGLRVSPSSSGISFTLHGVYASHLHHPASISLFMGSTHPSILHLVGILMYFEETSQ